MTDTSRASLLFLAASLWQRCLRFRREVPGAPVVANRDGIRELCLMCWGMPSSQKALLDAPTGRADNLRAYELRLLMADSVEEVRQ